MTLKYILSEETDYLLCHVSGKFDADGQQSIDFFPGVLAHCREILKPRVLVDIRETSGWVSEISRIIFYEKIVDQYKIYLEFGGAPLKVAFLVNDDYRKDYNPGLKLANQRDFPAILGVDMKKLFAWLLCEDGAAH